ncbi:MAG: bactofilin family protein [Paracoccaceae bacterium]
MNDSNKSAQSVVSGDLSIGGNLESTGTVVVHGTVQGHVSVAKLVLEKSGKIIGNVKADSADLLGQQKGKVVARILTIHAGAVLNGAVICEELVVESGASITGKFRVKPK